MASKGHARKDGAPAARPRDALSKVVVLIRANVTGLIVQADEELGLASVKRAPRAGRRG